MSPPKQARLVAVIPVNQNWYATPLFDDGTAGHSQRFTEVSAAWDWARTVYPGVRVTVQAIRKKQRSGNRVAAVKLALRPK